MFSAIPEDQFGNIVFSIAVLIVTYCVSFFIKKSASVFFERVNQRIRTVTSLFYSVIDIALFSIAILIILSHWDINIIPLLTGAGLAGLAISFGAQTLVKDIISGFFILIEDQFSVGDKVKIANVEGTVVRVTLRLTILKDKNNNQIYIPNSQIATVIRYYEKK